MSGYPDLDTAIAEAKTQATQAAAALAAVTGTGTSANDAVTATVDAQGRLRDIRISHSALRSPDRLRAQILQATQAAEADAASKAAEAMQPITSDPRLQRAQDELRQLLTPDQSARPQPQPMTDEEMDDYYRNQRYLQ